MPFFFAASINVTRTHADRDKPEASAALVIIAFSDGATMT